LLDGFKGKKGDLSRFKGGKNEIYPGFMGTESEIYPGSKMRFIQVEGSEK
jgi:hypothetical protein